MRVPVQNKCVVSGQYCRQGKDTQADQSLAANAPPAETRLSDDGKRAFKNKSQAAVVLGSTAPHCIACKTERQTWVVALLDAAQLRLDFLADKTQNDSKCKQPT